MDITIHPALLPHDDPDASLVFALGFAVRDDVEYGEMHRLAVGPADQPSTSIVLYPPAASPRNGIRGCAVRDPAGNLIRVQELR